MAAAATSPLAHSASRRHPRQHQDIAEPPPLPAPSLPTLKNTLPVPPLATLTPASIAAASRWLVTFALINFDLDEGPVHARADGQHRLLLLPRLCQERQPALQLAHPRLLLLPPTPNTPAATAARQPALKLTQPSPDPLSSPQEPFALTKPTPASDLCGYVYFVQERDPAVPRGYNQRSIVLITHLPDYAGLFSTLVSRLGPLYASQGAKSLATAFANIVSWPDPTPGADLELRFLGQDHKFIIPLPNQAQIPDPKTAFPLLKGGAHRSVQFTSNPLDYHVLASNPTTYLSYIMFGSTPSSSLAPASSAASSSAAAASSSQLNPLSTLSVSDLWLLWEILILAEPLVVFGATPDIVSDTVLHLKNLIRPIPFHANWRPYITIHDPDFGLLFGKNKARAVGLIGATNPIILTATHAWPNVLSLSQQGASLNHHIGLLTERKRVLHKNKTVVKQLLLCLERKDYHHADIVISRHFSVLTEQFLQPLQRYFTTLLPTAEGVGNEPRRTGTFNSELFLKSLKEHTTALEFRSRLMAGFTASALSAPGGFYTAFLRSPNFSAWLHRQLVLGNRAVRDRFFANPRPTSCSSSTPQQQQQQQQQQQDPDGHWDSSAAEPLSLPFVPLEPRLPAIKKLHTQLTSKKPGSAGSSPTGPTAPDPRSKHEYSTMAGASKAGGARPASSGCVRSASSRRTRCPSDAPASAAPGSSWTTPDPPTTMPGLAIAGLKKSRSVSAAPRTPRAPAAAPVPPPASSPSSDTNNDTAAGASMNNPDGPADARLLARAHSRVSRPAASRPVASRPVASRPVLRPRHAWRACGDSAQRASLAWPATRPRASFRAFLGAARHRGGGGEARASVGSSKGALSPASPSARAVASPP
ncbi:hypothetical protein PTTG_25697 [Puccinia triticina 1-1 BBBD Race 1]|uniref:UDENN domain-containing protein n=1 Tax=Puccinia triticina (isolate 1-1 / race 1 (BBBD)) TaxID=630390 RepID=A0A180H1F2_PUCT1|nr:hypothetical protein PTTG_25697 [Puccinia triticina 1-1 BBBD Race 1]